MCYFENKRPTKTMKIMLKNDISKNEIEINQIVNEIKHENIVKYFNHFDVSIQNAEASEELKLCMITEYCEVIFFYFK